MAACGTVDSMFDIIKKFEIKHTFSGNLPQGHCSDSVALYCTNKNCKE